MRLRVAPPHVRRAAEGRCGAGFVGLQSLCAAVVYSSPRHPAPRWRAGPVAIGWIWCWCLPGAYQMFCRAQKLKLSVGAGYRIRTCDPVITNHVLYQLS